MNKLTQEEFIQKANRVHNNKYDYSKVQYINTSTKVCIICPIHGEFWQTPRTHLNNHGCRQCWLDKNKSAKKNDIERICKEKFGDRFKYDLIGNEKRSDVITITCLKHNFTFKQRLINHIRGEGGCQLCAAGGRPYTTESFIQKAKTIHGDLYDYDKTIYINHDTPCIITCKKHGDFLQKPVNHLQNCGCPHCHTGKIQQQIFQNLIETFPEENWLWEFSPDWLGNQRIDICNERIKLAIEYNGEQHYMPINHFGGLKKFNQRLLLDDRKKNLLKKYGYRLYVIPYYDYNSEKIIKDIKMFLNYEN